MFSVCIVHSNYKLNIQCLCLTRQHAHIHRVWMPFHIRNQKKVKKQNNTVDIHIRNGKYSEMIREQKSENSQQRQIITSTWFSSATHIISNICVAQFQRNKFTFRMEMNSAKVKVVTNTKYCIDMIWSEWMS